MPYCRNTRPLRQPGVLTARLGSPKLDPADAAALRRRGVVPPPVSRLVVDESRMNARQSASRIAAANSTDAAPIVQLDHRKADSLGRWRIRFTSSRDSRIYQGEAADGERTTMAEPIPARTELSEADLDFVVNEAAPEAADRERLRKLLLEDWDFRKALVGDDKVFQRAMDDEEIFLKISPTLYFEILLHRALKDLMTATHTVERTGRQSIAVFDTEEVVEFLSRADVLEYLSQMLASFTRIQSFVVPVRVRPGIRRRIRYNDMDIDSLMRFCAAAEEPQRFGFYKRIADVCLFISGLFADHAFRGHRSTDSTRLGASAPIRSRRSLEEYEAEGRRFYGLAREHPAAHALNLSEVLGLLRQRFTSARKPLSFIASQYLHKSRHQLFDDQIH